MNIAFDLLKKLPAGNEQDIDWNNIAKPYPGKKGMPDWLIEQEAQYDDGGITIKKCQPFLDGLTVGYIIPFPDDTIITLEGKYDFSISGPGGRFLSAHGAAQYNKTWWKDKIVVKFANPWIIKTDSGYSSYIFHPNGHNIKPYYSIPAVVDTDKYYQGISIPFVLNEFRIGAQIEIKKGTPMAQVLPFKRESCEMTIRDCDFDKWTEENKKLWADPQDYYLKNKKQKKNYK